MEHRPSEEAVKAARDWLHEYGNEPSPLKMASDLAAMLDQFAARARLEEAKWWRAYHGKDYNGEGTKRISDLEAAVGMRAR